MNIKQTVVLLILFNYAQFDCYNSIIQKKKGNYIEDKTMNIDTIIIQLAKVFLVLDRSEQSATWTSSELSSDILARQRHCKRT